MNFLRTITLIVLPFACCIFAADIIPAPEAGAGMERGSWSLESWGNSGAADKVFNGQGQKLLKLTYIGEGKDKAAFKHLTFFGVKPNGTVRVQVYSDSDKPPPVGIALSTTPAYHWHEPQPMEIHKGWNKIEFNVGTKTWKTEASKWQFTVAVDPIDDVRAIDIVVYNGKESGALYIQGLQYDLDERGEKIAIAAKQLQSEDVDERMAAEKALVAAGPPAKEALNQLLDEERPEVLLRAASALRAIESAQEELPKDPKLRDELLKQKEEQRFEEFRRGAEYTLHGLENERIKLLGVLKDAHDQVAIGRSEVEKLTYVDVDKRKGYSETLDKLDAMVKELQVFILEKKKESGPDKK